MIIKPYDIDSASFSDPSWTEYELRRMREMIDRALRIIERKKG